jgi:aspartyl-tRNA(Asn)/glutamyl-tRNA(Gln) amidotransferase subunit C
MLHEDLVITARLARLPVTEAELAAATPAFEAMLENFSRMSLLDVDNLEPTVHALASGNRIRNDDNNPSTLADNILGMAPEREDRFIAIPNVL